MRSPNKFAEAIAEAATHINHGVPDPSAECFPDRPEPKRGRPENEAQALRAAEAAIATAAAAIRAEHGCAVMYGKVRVGRQKTSAEYGFWKIPVMSFIEFPETLDVGPVALARRHDPSQPFAVTKDTFKAPLSSPARMEARRLLKSRGFNLRLPAEFSIRDIQKAMKDQRDRSAGFQRFAPRVEIVGDTVYCDGESYKMSPTRSGKMRIKAGGGWLPVEALTAFLAGRAKKTEG